MSRGHDMRATSLSVSEPTLAGMRIVNEHRELS
jgi:hypothetical protein